MSHKRDIQVVRDLARQYAEAAQHPVQEERRALWRAHNSLQDTRPPVMATFGMWNVWCGEVFGDAALLCEDPFYREHERSLRMQLFQFQVGDDVIQEPWITQPAARAGSWGRLWGLPEVFHLSDVDGGAWAFDPQLKNWDDIAKLTVTHHAIDEEETRRQVERLHDAVGGILEIDVTRGCCYEGAMADISTSLARLRGLEQIMEDMYDAPAHLHRLLAFMRDGILTVQQEAEEVGAFSLTTQVNQSMTYCDGMEDPCPNSGSRRRSELWCFMAAQEFTLISPAMHDEFLLQYQMPIMAHWGPVAYGCCEDLTRKITMLRQIPNLRQIAVSPVADVAVSAEQIGRDYLFSWRPNPTDMICCGFDERKIRDLLRAGLRAARAHGCHVHLHLKDIETVEGEPDRLARWTRIAREVIEEIG